jgi:hypothetical protein
MRLYVMAAAIMALTPGPTMAQGPSGTRFETLSPPPFECAPPSCSGLEARRRPSRLARSVLIGAAIGAGLGLITVVLFPCDSDSNCHDASGRAALILGTNIAVGALVGLIVGASEPSRGPVPRD